MFIYTCILFNPITVVFNPYLVKSSIYEQKFTPDLKACMNACMHKYRTFY